MSFEPGATLDFYALKPKTVQSYVRGVRKFKSFCRAHSLPLDSVSAVDNSFALWIQSCFDSSESSSPSLCSHALYGLLHFNPQLKGHMGRSAIYLRGWSRLAPSRLTSPLTWPVTCAIAGYFASRSRLDLAVAILVGFDCYLRVSELCGIRFSDISLPFDVRLGGRADVEAMIRLPSTKTGIEQSVRVRRSSVRLLLFWYMYQSQHGWHSRRRLFRFDPADFGYALRKACTALGLSALRYTPHSMRAGGATCDYMSGMPIEDVCARGRWEVLKSCRRYIQMARSFLLSLEVPLAVHEFGISIESDLAAQIVLIALDL